MQNSKNPDATNHVCKLHTLRARVADVLLFAVATLLAVSIFFGIGEAVVRTQDWLTPKPLVSRDGGPAFLPDDALGYKMRPDLDGVSSAPRVHGSGAHQ